MHKIKIFYLFSTIVLVMAMMFVGCDTEQNDSTEVEEAPLPIKHYTVQFDKNGGTGTMADLSADVGKEITLPACTFTAPTGKKFGTWNTVANGSGTDYANSAKVKDLTTDDGAVVTLFAQWIEKDAHNIIYMNAKTAVINNSDKQFLESQDVTLPTITAAGYEFGGWSLVTDDVTADATIDGWNKGEKTADVTLWARMVANTYTIVFNANGGEGTMANLPMTYDVSADLTANTFTKAGCLFVGWALSANGEVVYTDGQEVNDLTADDGAEVILYAIWKVKIGAIMYSDMTFSSEYVSGKTPIGIVFEVSTKVKIVHLSEQSPWKWCLDTAKGFKCNPATSTSDGSGNWQIICDTVSDEDVVGNYPAFEYVNGLGSGWYLPAKDELNAVYTNKTAINTAITVLSNAGVSATSLGTDFYWSSSSYNSNYSNYACGQRFSDGDQYRSGKLDTYSVRAVRAF